MTLLLIPSFGLAQESCVEEYCVDNCAPQYCCPKPCGHFFLDADFLYLRAFEGGLSCVCDGTQINDTTVGGILVSTLEGSSEDPEFTWNPGFRLGVGYEFVNRCCDLGLYWTHYYSRAGGESDTREQKWNVDFNEVDLIYSCASQWSPFLLSIPFGGLRCAYIEQKLRTHFVSTVNGIPTISEGNSKETFFGLGPLVGIEGDWGIGCGFSLYGNVSFALLFGRFHVRSNQTEIFTTGINRNHLRNHLDAYQAVIDAGIGIRWTTCICCDRLLIIQLGLEEHRYFNHNQFNGYGDLSLDGLTLGVNILY